LWRVHPWPAPPKLPALQESLALEAKTEGDT
jgi:hypothetical protein